MLYENKEFCDRLAGIIHQLTPDRELQKDLMQEALVHVWRMELKEPGQTKSWYAQSCLRHLQNYLKHGTSIDTHQRSRSQVTPNLLSDSPDSQDLTEPEAEQIGVDDQFMSRFCAQENLRLLLAALSDPEEQFILNSFFEGMGTNEIARQLGRSHDFVTKHRQNIQALALDFGISREIFGIQNQAEKSGHKK